MAVLTIRNLPDTVRDRLRQRAARAGVSMEAQARMILTQSSRESSEHESVASLQAWVDELYRGSRPRSAVRELLAERRREVRVERTTVARETRSPSSKSRE